jgi:DNA-directed RNA polymerase subunit RPC12/RpoP
MRQRSLKQISYRCPKCGRSTSLREKQIKQAKEMKCSNPRCSHTFNPGEVIGVLGQVEQARRGFGEDSKPPTTLRQTERESRE